MAQYLPVLLVSLSAVTPSAPDDSSLDTQAAGQVDYLSHNWQEEDVARSWRNMTRRKDSIQNGARLENASWRTWWKQRNNLPTVSPETLNWLKDSDVTWLYGPLHTANDWAPPQRNTPSPSGLQTDEDLAHPSSHSHQPSPSNLPWALKPILKHRSISELLVASFPSASNPDSLETESDGYFSARSASVLNNRTAGLTTQEQSDGTRKRRRLLHTKSDTNVARRNPFRGDSPPLPLIPEGSLAPALPLFTQRTPGTSSSSSPMSLESSNGESASITQQKRHISFNTFVEQCIAIEKPKKSRDGWYDDIAEEDEYDVEDEGYREDDEDSNEEYASDEDVLEMRSTSSRSRQPSRSNSTFSGMDSEREHVTIAPIAPTILKTEASPPTGHGGFGLWDDGDVEEDELFRAHSPLVNDRDDTTLVPLVFVPPQGSVYAERIGMNGGRASGGLPSRSRSRSSSSSPADSFEDAHAYNERRREDVDFDPDTEDGNFDIRGVSDEVVYAPYRVKEDEGSQSVSEVRSTDSKGGSSEEGTVVPPPVGVSALPMSESSSSIAGVDTASTTSSSAPIPVPRQVHHSPSPAPSATSNSTATTNTSNGSGGSGSPFLDAIPRGRSTSPITSVSPSGESSRGRNAVRKPSSDRDFRDDRDPPRGRSRSRSIGADGSVSPRCGLSRGPSVESGVGSIGLGYSGSGYGCGSRDRERREPSSSLSPEDTTGDRRNGRVRVSRGCSGSGGSLRRVDSGSISGGEGSSSISPPATGRDRDVTRGVVSKPIDIPAPSVVNGVAAPPAVPISAVIPPRPTPTVTPTMLPDVPQLISTTPTPPGTSGSTTPTASSREDGSLVGRAVSTAKGYFGSFWNTPNGASAAQTVAR